MMSLVTSTFPRFYIAGAAVGCLLLMSNGRAMVIAGSGKTPFTVEEATIADIQKAILGRQVTTTDVVKLYLTRIKEYNGTCVSQPQGLLEPISATAHAGQLNALGTLNLRPAARQAWGLDDHTASQHDRRAGQRSGDAGRPRNRPSRTRNRTHGQTRRASPGVVVGIKDQFDTFDMRTTNGADIAYADDRPLHDSTAVARLRKAGAIILGKTNRGGSTRATPSAERSGMRTTPKGRRADQVPGRPSL